MKTKTFFKVGLILLTILSSQVIRAQELDCPTEDATTNAKYINSTITLKILLVEFSDVGHRTDPFEYTRQDFEDMLISLGSYVSPVSYTPDGNAVYGSMHDYFNKMSSGNVTITGYVVNIVDDNDIPSWVPLPGNKVDYHSYSSSIFTDAINAATAQGLDVSTSLTVKLAVIYAGNVYMDGGLNPMASGNKYLMSERQDRPYNQENTTDKFSRIGIHCHEFAHILGIGHASGSRADVMQAGHRNGNSAAPAPLNPAHRILKGWLSPTTITGQQQFDAHYSLINPQVFRIDSNDNNDYFLFANRRFNQTMVIGSTEVPDYNNSDFFPPAWPHGSITEGIFVWRVRGGYPTFYSNNGLIYASGMYGETCPEGTPSETDDGVPFPGNCDVQVLSPWSDPRDPSPNNPPNSGIFVPNTKNGTNVGMEILAENESQGFFTVMLYQTNPEDAKPSRPQNFQAVNSNGNPRMTWDSNLEPDLSGYRLYKYLQTWSSGADTFVISIHKDSTGYTDEWFDISGRKPMDWVTYWLTAIDSSALESIETDQFSFRGQSGIQWKQLVESNKIIPEKYYISYNYPNPFNPITTIKYDLPEDSFVKLRIFNLLGEEIRTLISGNENAGSKSTLWNGKDNKDNSVSSGMYIYYFSAKSLESDVDFHQTRKMVLLR